MKCAVSVMAVLLASLGSGRAAPDFEKDVAPILEARCLSCHGEQEAKGDLRLDQREQALAEVIAAGRPEESVLIEKIRGPKPEMPKKGEPLSEAEVRVLRDWIAAGALWPEGRVLVDKLPRNLDWWSLRPLPKGVAQTPVDALVEAKLSRQGLKPVAEADARTLVRRMSYDLTGLPPAPEEVAKFEKAHARNAQAAVDQLADRLLASPAFGEKWGQHWLDLARYAETHGYDKDKPRMNAWPYRDYVIRSFNEDKPYDRFVREQVAGDVLFPGTEDGIVALGFLAAGPWDFIGHKEVGEGKLDGRIAKHLDRDEMVTAVFNVFESTTVQCAQCHHHKFDPVKMEDYYRLHAVFAAVDRADRVYAGLPPERERERNQIYARVNQLRAEQEKLDAEIGRLIAAKVSGIDRRIDELKEKYGSGLKPQYGYHSLITKNARDVKWVQLDLGAAKPVFQVRLIPAFDNYAGIGAGFGFPVRFKVETSSDPEFRQDVRLLLDATGKDQPNPGSQTVSAPADGTPVRYVRITATQLRERKDDYIFALGEVEVMDDRTGENVAPGAVVTALDSIEQGVRWGKANLVDGIYFRELSNAAALTELRELQAKRAEIEAALRPPDTDQRLQEIKDEIANLNAKLKAFPAGKLVYAAATQFARDGRFVATEGKPREIHLLHRGDMKSPGDVMHPGVPPLWDGAAADFAPMSGAGEGEARAQLARYLTDQDNPLVWRSIANRVWQWTFGSPLAGTPNDLGRMGLPPTHPELLDSLAAQLRDDSKHSLKSLVRLLVTSRAYRRSSTHDEANAKVDGGNQYLWRANRRRLTAEEFRDSMLAVSGVLQAEDRGGPSFQDFVIEKPQHSPHYEYDLHDANDPKCFRRTIYRFVVRSQPQPMLTTLDCADPSMSVAQRDESTTALQALTQWNHRLVEAMAATFGKRIQGEKDPVGKSVQLALGRMATPAERAELRKYFDAHGAAALARVIFNLSAFTYLD
ncbi:MAG: DUF1549 domain-containing protein [Verrucomicrobiales bacterium]|nr:DUF1549 domain-containing protein [Verrucomicrobiales bacterium]